jgi:signal recognition particle GTPase
MSIFVSQTPSLITLKPSCGHESDQGVSPGQQFVKLLYDELVLIMGSENSPSYIETMESPSPADR